LSSKSVQVGVGGSLDFEVSSADIVQGFVVDHEGNIGVFQHSVSAENGVVGLNNSGGDLRRGVDGELDLGLLAVVNGETFKEEGTETRTSTTTEGVEDHKALKTSAVISKLSDSVQYKVNNFLANGVVTTGIVVGSIFLAGDELFRVEELAVGTSSNFIDDSGFKINHNAARNVLASAGFREESVEGVIATSQGLVGRHLTVRLNTVLQAEKFPAGITGLDTSLTNVNTDTLSHC
jgi:hypothetical protein